MNEKKKAANGDLNNLIYTLDIFNQLFQQQTTTLGLVPRGNE